MDKQRISSPLKKRFQVFISSTYKDLVDERRAVQDVDISRGYFPVQMESWPAADENQFEFIKRLINESDYYILIIAGMYGSTDENGTSYTELEYDYAVEQGIPVLVFLHANLEELPKNKTESLPEKQSRLEAFIQKATGERMRAAWTSTEELQLRVREALDHVTKTQPRTGWVRGDQVTSLETLKELNELRKEKTDLDKSVRELRALSEIPELPSPDSFVEVPIYPVRAPSHPLTIKGKWVAFLPVFRNHLDVRTVDWDGEYFGNIDYDSSELKIGNALVEQVAPIKNVVDYKIDTDWIRRLHDYFCQSGLMYPNGAEDLFSDLGQQYAQRVNILVAVSPDEYRLEVAKGQVKTLAGFDEEIPF